MSEQLFTSITSIVLAIIGLALVAVILSKNANTSGVVQAGGSALAQDLSAALSPVTGGSGIGFGAGINNYTGNNFTS